jgi:L-rhamnose isomerase
MFKQVKELYASLGVNVEQALEAMGNTPISLHCWQGDDVVGFEAGAGALGSGLAVTCNLRRFWWRVSGS